MFLSWRSHGENRKLSINFIYITALKIIFFLPQPFDHYPDPGGQATFYGSHKITILIWAVCFSKGLSTLDIYKFIRKIQECKFLKDFLSYFNSVVSQIIFS